MVTAGNDERQYYLEARIDEIFRVRVSSFVHLVFLTRQVVLRACICMLISWRAVSDIQTPAAPQREHGRRKKSPRRNAGAVQKPAGVYVCKSDGFMHMRLSETDFPQEARAQSRKELKAQSDEARAPGESVDRFWDEVRSTSEGW